MLLAPRAFRPTLGCMDVPGILHADLDAFYAAVAVLEDPGLAGKPVAVGAGVVLSCTYEAKEYGVRGGMRTVDAKALCPNLIVVDGTFGAYTDYSKTVFSIFESYTPLVEPLSIDEAFMDVTGSVHLLGSPAHIARSIREDVKNQTGLAVSIGVTARKFLSKIASQVAKPDGLIVVLPGEEKAFLHPLSASYLWGVGPVTKKRLNQLGIRTIGDIADTPLDALVAMVGGAAGNHLHALANNKDSRPVERARNAKSVSAQSAMRAERRSMDDLMPVLLRLTDRVASRLRDKDRSARTITVRVRFGDLSSVTRSETLHTPTASTAAMVALERRLLQKVLDEYPKHEITLLSVAAAGLGVDEPIQLAFGVSDDAVGGGTPQEIASSALDESVDELRRRFGKDILTHGSDLLSGRTTHTDGLSEVMRKDN